MITSTAIPPDALARKQKPARPVSRPLPQKVSRPLPPETDKAALTVRQQCVARREPFPFC
ncbi:hypothetical protein [Lignipirellula cremea]|uniref:Uncharacterized protein n=1 Tax=Lignipirellula cremea TaxID=2528010 RepID=A0A518E320_9BACT|nr:hypothetical protein [Lignipirellula cremea]QDU98495.1 hypothetical protein Pla8534_63640 [Lignipirellula cremea]